MDVVNTHSPSQCWQGASVEAVPSLRKVVRTVPRTGVELVIRPGLAYYVGHVQNEVEDSTNGVLQTITIEFTESIRMTRAYIYPTVSGGKLTEVIRLVVSDSSGKDILTGI